MDETRAILVTRVEGKAWRHTRLTNPNLTLTAAFDAAGDQPRIRWCAEHGEQAFPNMATGHRVEYFDSCMAMGPKPCRVVDAIVVPLEDAS